LLCSADQNQTLVPPVHFYRHVLCYFGDENVEDYVEPSSSYLADQPARADMLLGEEPPRESKSL